MQIKKITKYILKMKHFSELYRGFVTQTSFLAFASQPEQWSCVCENRLQPCTQHHSYGVANYGIRNPSDIATTQQLSVRTVNAIRAVLLLFRGPGRQKTISSSGNAELPLLAIVKRKSKRNISRLVTRCDHKSGHFHIPTHILTLTWHYHHVVVTELPDIILSPFQSPLFKRFLSIPPFRNCVCVYRHVDSVTILTYVHCAYVLTVILCTYLPIYTIMMIFYCLAFLNLSGDTGW